MTFLKSVKSAVMLAGIAGVLIFAGGAWADANVTVSTNNIVANGLTATAVAVPASDVAEDATVTVTVTLAGTAATAGTHTIGLTSATLGSGKITDPTNGKTVTVTAGETVDETFEFTFAMPDESVADLVVSNSFGATSSTVSETPTISTDLSTTKVTYVQNAQATALTVTATVTDGGALTYAWYKSSTNSNESGAAIEGATNASYTPSTTDIGDAYYYVKVTNKKGALTPATATSHVAYIAVEAPKDAETPVFEDDLDELELEHEYTLHQTENVRFMEVRASVTDGGTITYQWYKNDTKNTTGGTAVNGEIFTDEDGLKFSRYTPSTNYDNDNTSYYYVIVTNTNNAATGSNKTATLTSAVATVVVNNLTHAAQPAFATNLEEHKVGYFTDRTETVPPLTVTVSDDGITGTLEFAWYRNTTQHGTGGTEITTGVTTSGKTSSYTPLIGTVGEFYYYVVVTHTDNSKTGTKVRETTSRIAWISVADRRVGTTITFDVKGSHGEISAVDADGDDFVNGSTAEEDEVITFTAAPDQGYKVKAWYVDDVAQPLDPVAPNRFAYTVTSAAAKIEVEFEAADPNALTATFTASANGTVSATFNGNAILSGATVSNAGNLVITAVPASDYEVDTWTLSIGGQPVTSLTGLLNTAKTVLTIPAARITGSVVASVTFKAEEGVEPTAPIALAIVTQPALTTNIVAGNILSTSVLTSDAHVTGKGSTAAQTAAIEYRWFKPLLNSNAGTTDAAAAGSSWATAANGGTTYTLPADLEASVNYYYCRARVTVKANDGVTDSVMVVSSDVATVTITAQPVASISSVDGVRPVGPLSFTTQDATNSNNTSRTLTANGASISPSGTPSYRWFRNRTNSSEGGVVIPDQTGNTYVVPVTLEPGYYFYYCEVNNATSTTPGTAKVARSNVVAVTVNPKAVAGSNMRALPPQNIVQFSGATVDYTFAADMKLTIPAANANLIAPQIGTTKFEVTRIIYEGTAGKAYNTFVNGTRDNVRVYDKSATDATAAGSVTDPLPLTAQKVVSAGTYNVTVVVTAQSTVNVTESGASVPVTYVGSTQVTYTVREKDIGSIMTKTISMPDAVYSGFTKDPVLTLVDGDSKKNAPLVGNTVATTPANTTPNDYFRVNGNLTDAGTAVVTINGRGNYTGKTELSFAITKKVISVNASATVAANVTPAVGTKPAGTIFDKTYNGTTAVAPTSDVSVWFSGLVDATHQLETSGFTVSGLAFSDANAGTKSVTGNVTLDPTTVLGRNYSFASGATSASFTQTGVTIAKKTPEPADFDFTIPEFKRYTGVAQSIGNVSWKAPLSSTGDTRTVYYDAGLGMGPETKLPVEVGTYEVSVSVSGSNNFENGTVKLGDFKINPASLPTVTVSTKADDKDGMTIAEAYVNEAVTLRATGVRPDSAKIRNAENTDDSTLFFKGGSLSYIWFLDTATTSRWDTLKASNGRTVVTGPTYTVTYPNQTPPSWKYRVEATYTNPSAQVATKSAEDVGVITVRVNKEREDIASAVVAVNATPVYNGKTPKIEAAQVTVTLNGKKLNDNNTNDYTFEVFGEDAGVGVVSVTGINAYKGKASGTFTIEKALTTEDSLKYTPASTSVQYNGAAQPITIAPKTGDGLGKVTITYINIDDEDNPVTLTAAPKNAGKYTTIIEIAEGKNYTELEEFERSYTITKRFAVKEDFNYTMPKNGATPTAITATLKNPMGYTGTLTTVYTNVATDANLNAVPTTEGKYAVKVRVGGDDNFGMIVVTLDTLKIDENGKVGVKSSDREVPKSVETNVAAVAPVSVVASGFTAGPSPVSLSKDGAVKFFSAKSVKSGTLYIFDANGNSVAKKSVKSGSGEIGGWNLKDKKGAAVSEGTYVVKGALVGKDGKKEKVSFPFSVVK